MKSQDELKKILERAGFSAEHIAQKLQLDEGASYGYIDGEDDMQDIFVSISDRLHEKYPDSGIEGQNNFSFEYQKNAAKIKKDYKVMLKQIANLIKTL